MTMSFYTPGGLKIRLDSLALRRMIDASDVTLDSEDAFRDAELWADLPAAMCAFGGIVAAIFTHSVAWTIFVSVIAFAIGNVYQQFGYSALLRILFPQFLGSWMIAVPTSIATTIFLYSSGFPATAFTQLAVVAGAILGLNDFMLLLLIPVRVVLSRAGITPPIRDIELAFIAILNRQAASQGESLDWAIYNRERETNRHTSSICGFDLAEGKRFQPFESL